MKVRFERSYFMSTKSFINASHRSSLRAATYLNVILLILLNDRRSTSCYLNKYAWASEVAKLNKSYQGSSKSNFALKYQIILLFYAQYDTSV